MRDLILFMIVLMLFTVSLRAITIMTIPNKDTFKYTDKSLASKNDTFTSIEDFDGRIISGGPFSPLHAIMAPLVDGRITEDTFSVTVENIEQEYKTTINEDEIAAPIERWLEIRELWDDDSINGQEGLRDKGIEIDENGAITIRREVDIR